MQGKLALNSRPFDCFTNFRRQPHGKGQDETVGQQMEAERKGKSPQGHPSRPPPRPILGFPSETGHKQRRGGKNWRKGGGERKRGEREGYRNVQGWGTPPRGSGCTRHRTMGPKAGRGAGVGGKGAARSGQRDHPASGAKATGPPMGLCGRGLPQAAVGRARLCRSHHPPRITTSLPGHLDKTAARAAVLFPTTPGRGAAGCRRFPRDLAGKLRRQGWNAGGWL